MKRKITPKILKALKKAYIEEAISLSDTCPHCFASGENLVFHGECWNCGKLCGCSFSPTSRNDFCDFHRG